MNYQKLLEVFRANKQPKGATEGMANNVPSPTYIAASQQVWTTSNTVPMNTVYIGQNQYANASQYVGAIGGGVGVSAVWQTPTPPLVPFPVGNKTYYVLIDADGRHHHLCLDAAHIYVVEAINSYNRPATVYIKPTLNDPDFSLDELDQAEKVMAEMEP